MKRCSVCGLDLASDRKNSKCIDCYNDYMRKYVAARYHRRRQAFIDSRGGVCENCGSDDRLELDHVDPTTKSFSIGKALSSWAEEKVQRELAKCQVLCKVCHKEKTITESVVAHGGGVAGKRRCDCELCKAKKAEYMRTFIQNSKRKVRKCLDCPTMIDIRGKRGKCRRCAARDTAKSKLPTKG